MKARVLMVLLLGLFGSIAMAQPTSTQVTDVASAILPTPGSAVVANNCTKTREFRPSWVIDGKYNASEISLSMDWGDGTNSVITGAQLASYNGTTQPIKVVQTESSPGSGIWTTEVYYAPNAGYPSSGFSHPYNTVKWCMYQATPSITVKGSTFSSTAIRKVTIWSRDGDSDGMGELSMVESVTRRQTYLLCKGQATIPPIRFLNNSKIACNTSLNDASEPGGHYGTNWDYVKNQQERYYRFTYGVAGDNIGNVVIKTSGGDVTVTGPNTPEWGATVSFVNPYKGPVTRWPTAGSLSPDADRMNVLTDQIECLINKAPVGAIFTIKLEIWNACNPYSGDPDNPGSADVEWGYIKIADAPDPLTSQTLVFCNASHSSVNPYSTAKPPYDYTMNLGYTTTITPGKFTWYRDNNGAPGTELFSETYVAGYKFNPYTTTKLSAADKLNPSVAKEYKYWVKYEFSGDSNDPIKNYTCATDPVLMTWQVREDIVDPIADAAIKNDRFGCSGSTISFSVDNSGAKYTVGSKSIDYLDSYPVGGNIQYGWEISSDPDNLASSISFPGNGRTVTVELDKTLKLAAGKNGTVKLRVWRRWANTPAQPWTNTPPTCEGQKQEITITIYPLPSATLSISDSIYCAGSTPVLDVKNILGPGGSIGVTVSGKLNSGQTFSIASVSGTTGQALVDPNRPALSPPAASITEYFIYTLEYKTPTTPQLTCTSTNGYDGKDPVFNLSQTRLMPNSSVKKTTSPVNTPVRVIMRPGLTTAQITPISPVNTTLCANTTQEFSVPNLIAPQTVTSKDASTGGAPITDPKPTSAASLETEYVWSWTGSTDKTTAQSAANNHKVTFPTGTVTGSNAYEGVSKTLTVKWQYKKRTTSDNVLCPVSINKTYTIIPTPTASIPTQTVEICENVQAPATTTVTVNFTVTGYKSGNWTVGWKLSRAGMTDKTGTVPVINSNDPSKKGTETGTITLDISDFAHATKYGDYTLTLTSVTQAAGAPTDCGATPTATQTIKVLRKPEVSFNPGLNATICEGTPYTVPAGALNFTGESGKNYDITYRTKDNANVICTNPVLSISPLGSNSFTIPANCLDNAAHTATTITVELAGVTQGACSNTATGNFVLTIDRYPEMAIIDKSHLATCSDTILLRAKAPLLTTGQWYISPVSGSFPSGATVGTDFGFDSPVPPSSPFAHTSANATTIFGVTNNKYGQYRVVWKIGTSSGACPASKDSVIITLAKEAGTPTIDPHDANTCGFTTTLKSSNALDTWETGLWVIKSGAANVTSFVQTGQEVSITVNQEGDYEFEWQRNVPLGCTSKATQKPLTFIASPVVVWEPDPVAPYCPETAINITITERTQQASYTGNKIPSGQLSYVWTPTKAIGTYPVNVQQSGNIAVVAANAPVNTQLSNSSYPNNLVYPITNIRAINERGGYKCYSDVKNFDIIIKPTPQIANIAPSTKVCPGEELTYDLDPLITGATATNTSWVWTNNSIPATSGLGTTNNPARVNPNGTAIKMIPGLTTALDGSGYLIAESNQISLTVTVDGCPSKPMSPFEIVVNPKPVTTVKSASGLLPLVLCPNTDDELIFENKVENVLYTWTYPSSGNSNTNLYSSSAIPSSTNRLSYVTDDNLTSVNSNSTIRVNAYGQAVSDISGDVCQADAVSFAIAVKPRPNMGQLTNQQLCASVDIASPNKFDPITFTVSNRQSRTVNYTWENIGDKNIAGKDEHEVVKSTTITTFTGAGTAAGIYDILIPENLNRADSVAVIVVTPEMDGCIGDSRTVRLTALRRPVVEPIADEWACPGTPFATINPNVANTNIRQIDFTIGPPSWVKAPGGVGAASSYVVYNNMENVIFEALTNTTGDSLLTKVSVKAKGFDIPDKNLPGNNDATGCVGPATSFNLIVRPTPVITAPINNTKTQELCPEETFAPVKFKSNIQNKDSTKVVFSWTVQNNIGMGANSATGQGNQFLPGFTPILNVSGSKITATYRLTASLNGCESTTPVIFTQVLKPTPKMDIISPISVCPGEEVNVVGIMHNVAGQTNTGVQWKVNNTGIEVAPQSALTQGYNKYVAGNVPNFIAHANVATQLNPADIVGTFMVRAIVDQCLSDSVSYTVSVRPTPDILGARDTSFCHNDVLSNDLRFSSAYFPSGDITYEWKRTDVSLGTPNPPLQGTYAIPKFTARNASSGMLTDVVSMVTIHSRTAAGSGGCPSPDTTFSITIRAVPQLSYADIEICADSLVTPDPFAILNPNPNNDHVYYNWTYVAPAGSANPTSYYANILGLPLSGTDTNLPQFQPDISPGSPLWADNAWASSRINISIELNGCKSIGTPYITLQVNPLPPTEWVNPPSACVADGGAQYYQADKGFGTNGSGYHWGFKTLNNTHLYEPIRSPGIKDTMNYGVYGYPDPVGLWEGIIFVRERNRYGCWGDTLKTVVSIQPTPVAYAGLDREICFGDTVKLHGTVSRVKAGATKFSYNWQPGGILIENVSTINPTARPTETVPVSFYVVVDGCESNHDTMIITVRPKPGTPFISDDNFCSEESVWPMKVSGIGKKANGDFNEIRWRRDDNHISIPIGHTDDLDSVNMKNTYYTDAVPNPISYSITNEEAVITYYVRQINEYNCKSDSATARMTIRKAPKAPVTLADAYCQIPGQTQYAMSQAGNNVRWFYPDSATSVGYIGGTYWAPQLSADTFTYYVRQIGVNGCVSFAAAKNLIIHPLPKLNFSVLDVAGIPTTGGCADFTIKAKNTSPSPDSDVKYTWTWDTGGTPVDAFQNTTVTHTYYNTLSNAERHTLTLKGISTIYQNSSGGAYCQKDTSLVLTIRPRVIANFTVADTAGCTPLNTRFNSTSSVNAQITRWYWNSVGQPANGQAVSNVPSDPNYGLMGPTTPYHEFINNSPLQQKQKYHVWLQVENDGCFDSRDTIITVYPIPNVAFMHNVSGIICPPDSVLFTNNSVNSTPVSYLWEFGDGNDQSINTTDPVYHQYTNYTTQSMNRHVILTATNVFGCQNSADSYLSVGPQVQAIFVADTAGCSPITVQFVSLTQGARTYRWKFGDGATSAGQVASHQYINNTGVENIYDVWLTASNVYGCKDSISQRMHVYPKPKAKFDVDTKQGCQPLKVTFENISGNDPLANISYVYDFGDASIDNSGNQFVSHSYINLQGQNDRRWPKLIATNDDWGCTDEYSTDIVIYPYIKADFRMSDTVSCDPLTVHFTNGSQGTTNSEWIFGDGSISSIVNPTYVYHNTGMSQHKIYEVKLIVRSGLCTDTMAQKVRVYVTPKANFTANPTTQPFLSRIPITITNGIPSSDWPGIKHTWSVAPIEASNSRTVISNAPNPSPYPIDTWGEFVFQQLVTNMDGKCADSMRRTVALYAPRPIASFLDISPGCVPYTVGFTNKSQYTEKYLWEFGDGSNNSTLENPQHTYTADGVYTIKLTVWGANELDPVTYTSQIVVHPTPQAAFVTKQRFLWVGQTLLVENYSTRVDKNGNPYPVWYRWDWGDGTSVDTLEVPTHIYRKAGKFDISLTIGTYTTPQCTTELMIPEGIELQSPGDVEMPNTFKPSAEGPPSDVINSAGYQNYLFYPPIINPTRKYYFAIFNRWGQVLYQTTDPKRGWNGYHNGRLCDEGVYIYKIEGVFETGQSFSKMGDVLLMR